MSDLRDDLKEDFAYLNKRVVKYNMALKIMRSPEKPPCFTSVVDEEKFNMLIWAMQGLVEQMQYLIKEVE